MHRGGGSWGLAKHRQGGNGKNAAPPSRWAKQRRAMDANAQSREAEAAREAKREMQEFMDAREWVARHGRKRR